MRPEGGTGRPDARAAEAAEWLSKASSDLRAARHGASAEPPLTGDMAFHAQQAVEKSLKALLASRDIPFGKTHNLVELGRICADLEPGQEPLLKSAAVLTEYAWRYRYPGEAGEPDIEEADEAVELAAAVVSAITRLL